MAKEVAFDEATVKNYVERLFRIENEIATLRDDKTQLNDEFKGKINFKLVSNAIRLVKIQMKLEGSSEQTIEEIRNVVLDKINMVVS